MKKTIYIAGPITGVDKYWEAFERAEEDLIALDCIPLTPSYLPEGLTLAKYARIDFAMIDSADAVLFLEGWESSKGARLEKAYCDYICKPCVVLRTRDEFGVAYPRDVRLFELLKDLKEVGL